MKAPGEFIRGIEQWYWFQRALAVLVIYWCGLLSYAEIERIDGLC